MNWVELGGGLEMLSFWFLIFAGFYASTSKYSRHSKESGFQEKSFINVLEKELDTKYSIFKHFGKGNLKVQV